MSNINLKQLEVFVAIVEWGSFTEAAKRLYLAQSTASSHIHALEETLQVLLLRRESKKRIELTEEGKRVYQYARDIVDKCNALERNMLEDAHSELFVGASTAPAYHLVPNYLAAFSAEHPECRCTLKNGDSGAIQQMLLDREIQVGFVGSADNRQELSYECIAKDRLVLITPNTERYRKMHEAGRLGHELLTEPMISREYGSGTQKMIDNYLSSIAFPEGDIRIAAYVNDPFSLQRFVAEGAGVAIISYLTGQEHIAAGQILAFDLEDQPVERNIYMAWRKKSNLSKLAKEFIAFVRKGSGQ